MILNYSQLTSIIQMSTPSIDEFLNQLVLEHFLEDLDKDLSYQPLKG